MKSVAASARSWKFSKQLGAGVLYSVKVAATNNGGKTTESQTGLSTSPVQGK